MNHLELRDNILRYYSIHPERVNEVISEKLEFLRNTDSWDDIVFLYDTSKYRNTQYQVFYEDDLARITVPEFDTSLIIGHQSDPVTDLIGIIKLLLEEQDPESPHHYEAPNNEVAVFDFGCSEGIYGNKYCNETHEYWGFDEDYWLPIMMKNVSAGLVNFRGGIVDASTDLSDIKLTLPLGMIKLDVEGAECDIIHACKNFINEYHPTIQAACYHYNEQCSDIIKVLKEDFGYENIALKGPMLFPQDQNQYYPYFRYGLVIAK